MMILRPSRPSTHSRPSQLNGFFYNHTLISSEEIEGYGFANSQGMGKVVMWGRPEQDKMWGGLGIDIMFG